jgi:hypothetical protein
MMKQSSGRLSPRSSILVWVAGIVVGWGFAFVLVYQVIRGAEENGATGRTVPTAIASEQGSPSIADIAPAAGPVADPADEKSSEQK